MTGDQATPLLPAGMRTIGVIGAGVIGASVAQALAGSGLNVILIDVTDAILAAAVDRVRTALRAAALTSKRSTIRPGDVLARIETTTDTRRIAAAQFVIENIVERWPDKCNVYRDLDTLCPSDVVFAVNTSTFPVADIAGLTQRPEKVVGIHFMNPVAVRPMVEVIPGHQTSAATLARADSLLRVMGKTGVIVGDRPGFVSNRVLMLMINEAISVVEEGTASALDVDRLFRGCFGHPMGPLATADLIGLDTILLSLESLRDRLGDRKFEPTGLLRTMVDSGQLGRKNGTGFFRYQLNVQE